METVDLNWFAIDCRFKVQQVAMLQSMRQSRDDRFWAAVGNAATPWSLYTNTRTYVNRHDTASGQTNWMIDQHLLRLRDCP